MSDDGPALPEAVSHAGGWAGRVWSGAIWALPIAAAGIVIWLGVRSWASSGPDVTVTFPVIANLKVDDTKVEFQGLEVGQVSSVHIGHDLQHTRVTLALRSDLAGHLGKGTQFWIGGRSLSLTNLSDLKSILSGAYIGIDPQPGPAQPHYVGLAEPPVYQYGTTGTRFLLDAKRLGNIERGTPIYYRDQQVGAVSDTRMLAGGTGFTITAYVDGPYDKLVRADSRFWSEGAVQLNTGAGGPAVQFRSLPALFQGAIAFDTPAGPTAGDPARPDEAFTLYDSQDAAAYAPEAGGVAYRVVFHTAPGPLASGAAVTLMGNRIGSVRSARLRYDPADGQLGIDATIVLDPTRIALAGDAAWTAPRAQMDALMRRLIEEGLHAELTASPPVIGGQSISLRLEPGGQAGTLGSGVIPEIPTLSGSGVQGIMTSVSEVASKLDRIPFGQIGDNLHAVSSHLAALAQSPQIERTLRNVDATTENIERLTGTARRELPETLADVRRAVDAAQATLASAHTMLAAQGGASGAPGTEGLPQTLYEIDRAARSLRALSDFLDRHPAALLRGRGADQ